MKSFKGEKWSYHFDRKRRKITENINKKIKGYEMAGDKKADYLKQQLEKVQSGLNVPKDIKDEYHKIKNMLDDYSMECHQIHNEIKQKIRHLLWSNENEILVCAYKSLKSSLNQIKEEKEKALDSYTCFDESKEETPSISSIISRISSGFNPKINELEGVLTEARKVINKRVGSLMQSYYDNQPFFKIGLPIARHKMDWQECIEIEYQSPDPEIRKITESAYENIWQDYLKQDSK
ncbi:MAG: hypothetical protein U9R34_05785 [Nanoarchaeota archaeon]|nr:hypothetical protein [Nanoarchaeota archaeon]